MKNATLYNTLAILCGVWFLVFGIFWTYWIAVVVAYPAFFGGMYLWYKASKAGRNFLNILALIVLMTGLVTSLAALFIVK
jgi:hypothetical protein